MRSLNPLIELWTVLLLIATTIIVISLTLVIGPEQEESVFRFIGRFHVLVLHFPIVLLLIAPVFDLLSRKSCYKMLDKPAEILWLLACISVVVTVLLGMALAATDGFNEAMISFHLTAGISVAVLALVCFGLRASWRTLQSYFFARCYALGSVILIVMVLVTAHAGGNLVHGKHYLTEFTPKIFQLTPIAQSAESLTNPTINDDNAQVDLGDIDDIELDLDSELSAVITRSTNNNPISVNTTTTNSDWQVVTEVDNKTTKFAKRSRFMMKKYCFNCHNKQQQSGNIRLDNLPYKPLTAVDKQVWELSKAVIEQAELHAIDAKKESRKILLTPKEQRKLLSWIAAIN